MSSARYVKTEKGRLEIETRAGGLPAKSRRLLIMIDGTKTLGDLMSQTGLSMDMDTLLAQLLQEGYVALEGKEGRPPEPKPFTPPAPPSPAAPPVIIHAAPVYEPVSEEDLAAVRRLMLDCARIYLGLMGADIARRIEASATEQALRACVPAWHMAMRESKAGRLVAEAHFKTVHDVLHVEDN